jgi:hypothetical protein
MLLVDFNLVEYLESEMSVKEKFFRTVSCVLILIC